jgi:tetratricopeptide (TPR) repeat protein
VLPWWREWRERRAALRDLAESQRREEAMLIDQNLNPLNLAKLCLDSGDTMTAASHWERALVHLPTAILQSPDSLEILLTLGRLDEAETLMRRRQERFPRDRHCFSGLARIAEQRGDIEEALKRWTVVIGRVRDSSEGEVGCARCLVALGRLDEAEWHWNSALRRDPDSLHAWVGRAQISDWRMDWPESLSRWKYIVEAFDYAPAHAFVAKALDRLDRNEEAEAWLEDPSRIYPSDLEIAMTRAHLAQRRGDLIAACDRWARVRANNPWYQGGYHEGAHRLFEAGRYAEAEDVLRAAIERFPAEAWPTRNYARLAHDRRDWIEAILRWESLRRRFPNEDDGYTLGADALRAAGHGDEAAATRLAP